MLVSVSMATGITGKVQKKDGSASTKVVKISVTEYRQSTTSAGGYYQLELPDSARGRRVNVHVDGKVVAQATIPKKGYAEVNIIFD